MRVMRIFLIFFLSIDFLNSEASDIELKNKLKKEYTEAKAGSLSQIDALVNLSDYYNGADNNYYTHLLLQKSVQKKSIYGKRIALTSLLRYMINTEQNDSLYFYKKQIKNLLPQKISDYLINYADLMEQTFSLSKGDTTLSRKIIEANQNLVRNTQHSHRKLSLHQQMVVLLITGRGYLVQMMTEKTNHGPNEAIKCFLKAYEIAKKLPFSESLMFREQSLIFICDVYTATGGTSHYAKELIDLETQKEKTDEYNRRPYAERSKLVKAYASLSCAIDLTEKENEKYYSLFRTSINRYMPDNLDRKVTFYSFSLNYYLRIKKNNQALLYCDSLLNVLKTRPSMIPNILYIKSEILSDMHKYKEANEALIHYVNKSDSLQKASQAKALDEVQTQLNVNKLELENANLYIAHERTKRLVLILGISILFVVVAGVALYLWKTRKLYRLLQKSYSKLSIESKKANESETMKSSFMQLICTEVKIPLNVTNELMMLLEKKDITLDQRQEIRSQINGNLKMLSTEIDNMLQISKLDSSQENFEVEDADVYALCYQCMMKVKNETRKANLMFFSNIKAGTRMPVNRFYFSYLMENIIENASRFTENGEIVIDTSSDEKHYYIYVSDTGIGIPLDKQEYVFERFAKISPFTPGTGVGLYLCRLIMKRMNGSIYIDPEYKDGTRVVIEINKSFS